jgi:uncharacterized membrane protein
MNETVLIILAGGVMTYLARAGGHVVLSRFKRIHPRVEAGLDAVPAAVLTTLFAPALFSGGTSEIAAMAVAFVVALRFSGMMPMFLAGAAVLIALRQLGL